MHTEIMTNRWPLQTAHPGLPIDTQGRPPRASGLSREQVWRQPPNRDEEVGSIIATRWVDERATARQERSAAPADCYIIAVALRPVRVRLGRGAETIFEGTMPTGMVHVTEPAQIVEAEFFTPCDAIHFYITADHLRDLQLAGLQREDENGSMGHRSLRDLLVRDDLAAQLSRTLSEDTDGVDPLYVASVGQTVLMRLLARRAAASHVGALPKWRLRRVQEHLAANISEPISLADLADAAGLSRMHFAAQFRVATGCRPHDYLLQHRIECAKQMLTTTDTPLVEVALSVGFQTQSHFSTVFKRQVGDSPARWQRDRRAA